MKQDKAPGGLNPGRPRRPAGEQFADPLAWTPENRPPPMPTGRSQRDEAEDRRERDINRKILQDYGRGPLDSIKPLIGIGVIGLLVFSQMRRADMANAIIYSVMAMGFSGALYTIFARDTMPPLLSLLFKGAVWTVAIVAVLVLAISYSATGERRERQNVPKVSEVTDQ